MSFALLFLGFTAFVSAQQVAIPLQPDYENAIYWYGELKTPVENKIDIFYVYPTVETRPIDENGNRLYYTNIDQKTERDVAAATQRFNMNVYGRGKYNFFAPFYRQITMDTYAGGKELVLERIPVPVSDIAAAFDYYIKHLNGGRPFILLGHSQGSQMIIELLKHHLTSDQRKSMIAAYTMGYEITAAELAQHPTKLRPAQSADDLGVIILYNSLTNISAKSPVIDRSAVCINPLNWKTDGTPAAKDAHKGIVRYDKKAGQYITITNFTGAYIADNYLICTDIDPKVCYIEEFKELFPFGNLHTMDSWLYAVNIGENMDLRAAKFMAGPAGEFDK